MKIAFSGKLCSGKTTAANQLIDMVPGMVRLSFATRLKELATELFGMTHKDRKLLQDLGAALRGIDGNVWIRAFERQVSQCQSRGEHVVVDDLRFRNEYNCLRNLGFTIIRLEISPEVQLSRLRDTYPNDYQTHVARLQDSSETDLDNQEFDYIIKDNENLNILLHKLVYGINTNEK